MTLRTLFRSGFPLIAVILLIAAVRGRTPASEPPDSDLLGPPSRINEEADTSRLMQGLEAFDAGQVSEAIALLREPAGFLEDWRLLILAESAHLDGDAELAETALSTLIHEHRGSPIRSLAIQRAAQVAAEHELWEVALRWIELSRTETVPADMTREIETLAWEMGLDLERSEIQSQAGRRLLVEHPLEAEELDVGAYFRQTSHGVDWTNILTQEELQRRARRQIDSRQAEEALETLDRVPTNKRSFDWLLLHAEALTRDRQGREALEQLAALETSDTDRQVAIAWQRALAAREAARVRRGRSNLPQSRREEMRALARSNLARVADLTPDPLLRRQALQLFFASISDEEDSFEPSLAVLRRLQELDPEDTTGTGFLWRLGWQAYAQRDYPVAIGYWSELESLYPWTTSARSGRYWTGRSHEMLGHETRAHDIYRQIVATQADDFYSRHARNRLAGEAGDRTSSPRRPTEPWPQDPALDRAVFLRQLGLNGLALHELDGQEAAAEKRAFCAEKAVVLARLGQRRDSIQSLACAFPALGKAHQSIVPQEALKLYYPLDFRPIIEQRAKEQELPPQLVFAMVRQESAFDAEARSWAGARGLMQLMPATGKEMAQRLGLRYSTSRLNDPDFSVRLGTRYYRQVLDMFDGNHELALAGYNGGPYRIKKLWRRAGTNAELDRFVEGLSLEETKTYVKRILLFEDSYHRLYSSGG